MDAVKGERPAPLFAFEAISWPDCVGPPVVLKQVFRQKDESMFNKYNTTYDCAENVVTAFIKLLNEMRLGRLGFDAKLQLKRLDRRVKYDDGIEPTELYVTRRPILRMSVGSSARG